MSKSTEKTILLLTDFVTVNLVWVLYFVFRTQTGWFDLLIMPDFVLPMLAVYVYWFILFSFVGMYRTWFAFSRFDELSLLFKATFVGIFLLFFLILADDYLHGVSNANRVLIFIYWGMLLGSTAAGRLILRSVQRGLLFKGVGRRNTLILGFNKKGHEIHEQISSHRGLGLDVTGYVTTTGDNLGKEFKGVPVIGTVNNLMDCIARHSIKEIVISLDGRHEELLIEIISMCENKDIGLKIVPDLYDILSGHARTSQLYGVPLIDINPTLMPEWEKKVKRIMDIIAALIILILTAPITLLTVIAIRLNSPGPAFFRQERCGLNGKPFKIYKFRSMYIDAEKATGPVWSTKDDPRVTPVGRFIRKNRIDEIPQMLNVLKGEMSLVGPRPERPFFVEKLAKEIPYYTRRLRVRPGITGWAQVKHKYDESIEDVKEKLRFDLFYIENMSLRMDLKILFRTIFVVVFGKGHFD